MAAVLFEFLANGLELWNTGAIAGLPLNSDDGGKRGGFLAKKEFGTSGVELEKVYEEAEILIGRIVDVVRDIGGYGKAVKDIAVFVNEDVEFRKSVLERRAVLHEVKPTVPVTVGIAGTRRPHQQVPSKIWKSGDHRHQNHKSIPRLVGIETEERQSNGSCNVHCELDLILHVIRRECSIRNIEKEPGKFLTPSGKVEMQKKEEDPDDLPTIVSHLKGLTAQPGMALRGWFSGVTQQGQGGKSSTSTSPKERPGEQKEQRPESISLTQTSLRNKKKRRLESRLPSIPIQKVNSLILRERTTISRIAITDWLYCETPPSTLNVPPSPSPRLQPQPQSLLPLPTIETTDTRQ
ncbi:uncharacterized protein DFL_009062 [Arthrobotrys flagrans]|uniref:Uncharacterized protein n=1 Tax=Arthrobotrys flagrans TaxID=97331 RepID=A0A436ZQI6_ARTFL|nr:hypothetical protein DFL_009062 [Arthrobotrys flagrans]